MNPEEELPVQEEQPELEPPLYTCETVLNVQAQQEASEALTPKYMKYIVYVCLGLFAVMFALLLWSYLADRQTTNLVLALLVLAVGVYLGYRQLTAPKKLMQQWEESMRKNYGTDALHLLTEFYRFSVAQTLKENNDVLVDSYTDLLALRETEHLFLLKKGRGNWYFLAKDGLKNCSADEFRTFISERIGGK